MSKLDIVDLERELKQGKFRPIYIIVGSEHHLVIEAMEEIRRAIGGEKVAFPSETTVSARDLKVGELVDSLRTVPMLGGRPLAFIREAESLSKANQEKLASYIESPADCSTLVIVASKLDGRSRLMQLASRKGALIECRPLYLDRVPSWIAREVKKRGRQIAQAAAEFITQMIGADLGQLTQAIERVILYVGDKKILELKDVEQAIAETHQHTIFELTDAVGSRSWPRVFFLLTNILENGESPILVLNMLARHFRILSKAREATGRVGEGEMAKYLGVHPYFARGYLTQSKNFSAGELREAFRLLHRCDRELKSSKIPKEKVLERAIFSLMRQKDAPPLKGRRQDIIAKNEMTKRSRS